MQAILHQIKTTRRKISSIRDTFTQFDIDYHNIRLINNFGFSSCEILNDKILAYGNVQLCGNTGGMEEIYNRYNRKIQY